MRTMNHEVGARSGFVYGAMLALGMAAVAGCGAVPDGSSGSELVGNAPGNGQPSATPSPAGSETKSDSVAGSDLAEQTAALVGPGPFEFERKPGQQPQNIMLVNDGMCFLTGVSGAFTGTQNAELRRTNGVWVLDPGGVRVRAACYPWSTLSSLNSGVLNTAFWTFAYPVDPFSSLQLFNLDGFCSIRQIAGALDGAGEDIVVRRDLTHSFLDVHSLAANGTSASVSCVAPNPGKNFDPIGAWIYQGNPPIVLASVNTHACALTTISGRWRGGGETAEVRVSNGQWVFSVTSGQVDVSASVNCVPLHW